MLVKFLQWCCSLSGHQDFTVFEKHNFALYCVNCKRRTPGIWIKEQQ